MIAALIAGLLFATDGAPHQDATQQAMQIQVALDIAKRIELGATAEQVGAETRRLGVADSTLLRCAAGAKCAQALDRNAATKRIDKWIVSDHTLVVVLCGDARSWRAAAVDLSTLDRPDPLTKDPGAVYLKKDEELAKTCAVQ